MRVWMFKTIVVVMAACLFAVHGEQEVHDGNLGLILRNRILASSCGQRTMAFQPPKKGQLLGSSTFVSFGTYLHRDPLRPTKPPASPPTTCLEDTALKRFRVPGGTFPLSPHLNYGTHVCARCYHAFDCSSLFSCRHSFLFSLFHCVPFRFAVGSACGCTARTGFYSTSWSGAPSARVSEKRERRRPRDAASSPFEHVCRHSNCWGFAGIPEGIRVKVSHEFLQVIASSASQIHAM